MGRSENLKSSMKLLRSVVAGLVLLGGAAQSKAGNLYGSNFLGGTQGGELLTINTSTGAGTSVGPLGLGRALGLAFDSSSDTLYGANNDFLVSSLVTINPFTGAATSVGPFGVAGGVQALAFDPNTSTLYGSLVGSELLTINTSTGAATSVGPFGLSLGAVNGLAFDPNTNTLYGSTLVTDVLVTINTSTGAGTLVGPLGFGNMDNHGVEGLAFDPNTNTLYGSDEDTDQLLTINTSTGAGTAVGPLGFDIVLGLAWVPEPTSLVEPLQLDVTYKDFQVTAGDLSFGLNDPPPEVAARFILEGTGTSNGLFDLVDVISADLTFGDGTWTEMDLNSFRMTLGPGGISDIQTLDYGFDAIQTPTVRDGLALNNSFQLTIQGTDLASGQPFEYLYPNSEQTLTVIPEPSTWVLFGMAATGLLAARIRVWPLQSGGRARCSLMNAKRENVAALTAGGWRLRKG